MAQSVTLGGDRLGSGNKQKVWMKDYQMTSFNLEQDFKSSMAPGILYPFLKLVGTNHDTFDIDLDSVVRTLPTKGPLFGSFKLQCDLFMVPMRLYQGILHNNPVAIGMKMNQVYLPKLEYKTDHTKKVKGSDTYNYQVNDSALLKYLGFSGAGRYGGQPNGLTCRKINAIPALAYYDIFKCYYSNKQEEKAYVIIPDNVIDGAQLTSFSTQFLWSNTGTWETETGTIQQGSSQITIDGESTSDKIASGQLIQITGENTDKEHVILYVTNNNNGQIIIGIDDDDATIDKLITEGLLTEHPQSADNNLMLLTTNKFAAIVNGTVDSENAMDITINISPVNPETIADITLQPFDLANIDTMRMRLLSSNELGSEFVIDRETDLLPYSALVNITENSHISWNAFADNGLVVKTYQSDLFNNWLNTEYIDGENGIAALTAVNVSNGKFLLDSLNLAEKLYDLYNRVVASGGTYEDWQEAVYGEGAVRKAETPVYLGGMSAEVMFEEVISSAETNVDNDKQPLGSLGGRGKQFGKKGGNNIHINCEEPCYIMGIASLTPRISYSQGNDWDITELDTLDDLHKPQLDGIGFQDLLVEQFAWWNTVVDPNGVILARNSAGKQTAWINYQTAVDKCYGDFARSGGYAFMALNRNYERDDNVTGAVKDVTTYIDPAKFNYAFAVTDLAAQNFWTEIHSYVVARRKMGAQQIPNF